MPLIKLDIPAGIYSHGSDLDSKGRWLDSNFVRWTNNSPEPVGGWVNLEDSGTFVQINTAITGLFRGSHAWTTNGNAPYMALGSYNSLYLLTGTNALVDITPTGLTPGQQDAGQNLGYGGGVYGDQSYGVPRQSNYTISAATTWTLSNFGQNLIACSDADGNIYELIMDDGQGGGFLNDQTVNATIIPNAPTANESIIVTAERFVFALGSRGNNGSPRLIRWSDRENSNQWTPAVTNQAGDLELQTTGEIVCAKNVRGRTIILTTDDAWVANYQGPPLVYGFQKVGDSCGVVGKSMAAAVGASAIWMGERNFFVYDGSTVRVLQCDVHDKVFTEMSTSRMSHGFCVSNQKFNEVWWFYPGDGDNENTRYVAYDYNEGHWLVGALSRTAGVDSGSFDAPLYIDEDGYIYRHETGYTHAGVKPFIESGPINLGEGDNVVKVSEFIPEEDTIGEMAISFKAKFYPNDVERVYGPYDPSNPTNVRFTGRQFKVLIEGDDTVNWRFGDVRLRVENGGRR